MSATTALFDLEDFEEARRPAVAPDLWGCGIHERHRQDDEHATDCWHNVCPSCGEEVANGWMMRLNHAPLNRDGVCTSLMLRLNHLSYAIRNGREWSARDMTVLDLGWRIAPDGAQIAPAGWNAGAAA